MNWTRTAIVGTAESWRACPWNDPGLTICSLNDAHSLKPPRADAWYDLHPLDHFIHPPEGEKPRRMYAHEVPPGYYIRPAHHLEFLAKLDIPVFLHPDFQTQEPTTERDKAAWELLKRKPNVQPFPRKAIEAEYGRYFTSSPAWMMAHMLMQGCRELHIYGIHLSTEHEYIEQRPNFEFLIGRLLGAGKTTYTEQGDMRMYATEHGRVILPKASPVLASDFQYAFDTRPRAALEPLRWELHKVQLKRDRIIDAIKRTPSAKMLKVVHQEADGTQRIEQMPLKDAQDQLFYLDAYAQDWQDQMSRVGQQWSA